MQNCIKNCSFAVYTVSKNEGFMVSYPCGRFRLFTMVFRPVAAVLAPQGPQRG